MADAALRCPAELWASNSIARPLVEAVKGCRLKEVRTESNEYRFAFFGTLQIYFMRFAIK